MDNSEPNSDDTKDVDSRQIFRLSLDSSTRKSSLSSDSALTGDRKASGDTNSTIELPDEAIVKAEKYYDDALSDAVPPSPLQPEQSGTVEKTVKRGRGRPRKQPQIPQTVTDPAEKRNRGRSKTGCKTCRLRKKKCDETKPICLNCQKSQKVCEGFPTPEPTKGKEPASDRRSVFTGTFPRTRDLPTLIGGVETPTDRRLLNHFVDHLTQNLSLGEGDENPYIRTILPMAMSHRGLMHSILFLSASHLSSIETSQEITQRQDYHYDIALNSLLQDIEAFQNNPDGDTDQINDATIAQTIMFCLQANTSGNVRGEYRKHLNAARHFLMSQKSENKEFQDFFNEFLIYHEVSSSLTSLDRRTTGSFRLPRFIQPEAGSYLGVLDELFSYLSQITILRDRIRERRSQQLKPLVDLQTMAEGQKIDDELRAWVSPHPQGTPRFVASLLYRQCTWIYLYRTLLPSEPNENLRDGVEGGLIYLRGLVMPHPPSADGTSPVDQPNPGGSWTNTKAILLMPAFLLGCAAFDKSHRCEIADAFQKLQEFRNSGNILQAFKVVETVWEMMDKSDENSWDWESLMNRMGVDFLVT